MGKPIIYVAHPVSGDSKANAARACRWVKWFVEADPTRIYIAPWVAEVLGVGDAYMTEDFYRRILDDDMDVVARLDGLIAVGGKWSRGMELERACARALNKPVVSCLVTYVEPSDVRWCAPTLTLNNEWSLANQ